MLLINNVSVVVGRLSPTVHWPICLGVSYPSTMWWFFGFWLFCSLLISSIALGIACAGITFFIDLSVPLPKQHFWLISACILVIIELLMLMQSDFWAALGRLPLDGLGAQGMHLFTYAFLFFLWCKASFHHWLERLDSHPVVRSFRFSVVLSLSLFVLCIVCSFAAGGSWPIFFCGFSAMSSAAVNDLLLPESIASGLTSFTL